MSYPRNAAAPPTVTLGAILQISDGAAQTSGASVRVKTGTGAWGAGAGTLACDSTSQIWTYLPTQGETDDTHFSVAAYKTGCVPVGVTIITSASATAGYGGVDWAKLIGASTANNLSGTTVKTLTDAPADSAGVGTLLARLTSQRAALLDNLANLDAAISSLNNLSALANLYGSPLLEIPDSSSTSFAFTLVVRDSEGKLVDLDASPTIAAANAAGTSRSANLSSVTHAATGRYTFTYSVASTAAEESLRITCSGTVSAEARYIEWIGAVVNYDTLTTLLAVKAKTDLIPASPAATGDIPSASTIALAVAGIDIDGKTLQAALCIVAAIVGGVASGAGTSTEVFKGLDGSTTRATVTADTSGNRTAVTYA